MATGETVKSVIRRNLKQFMEERGFSQTDLELRTGIGQGTISKWLVPETSDQARTPGHDHLAKVAPALGRPIADFFAENPPPPRPMPKEIETSFKIIFQKGTPKEERERIERAARAAAAPLTPERAHEQARLKEQMLKGTPKPKPRKKR